MNTNAPLAASTAIPPPINSGSFRGERSGGADAVLLPDSGSVDSSGASILPKMAV